MTASTRPPQETIGIIGLGLMGQAFARRLLAAGFQVAGYDVNAVQGKALTHLGGDALESIPQIAAIASRVVLSLPDHLVTARVLEELIPSLKAGHCLIDTTTGAPADAERHAEHLAALGVTYLDATISGSSAQVEVGEAVLMAGGTDEAFGNCGDIFKCLGAHALHTGPAGTGTKMKLVTNLVLGINRAALAEGLAFARALELEAKSTLAVLRSSMAYSRIMDTKGEKMLSGDFTPQARLAQHLKDVRLMLDSTDLDLPLTQAHRCLLERAVEMGLGALDNSAIIRTYDVT